MEIEINTNVQEMMKKFSAYSGKIADHADRAVKKSARLVERYSKIYSPVSTGRLRSSISVNIQPLRAEISPHVKYAIYVHEGTRYMLGRPFMYIGASEAAPEINDIFASEINEALA